jgi:GntR family transcriptional repressor for pyruvate dehydrogenase complex
VKKIEFESLKIRRATDIIENRISNMIIKGTIKPCEKLPTEKELSDQFDVSIVTIREALRGLEVAGLIEKKRGRGGGIYVTQINSDSVKMALNNYLKRRKFSAHHLAEVRLMVEPPIIRIIALQITPDELQGLQDNILYCERRLEKTTPAFPFKEYFSIGEKNIDFHRLIAQATHNPVFVLTIDYLMDFIFDFKKSIFTPDIEHCAQVVVDHRRIFTSLEKGNAEEAEARMLSHLRYLEKYQMNEGIQFESE